MKIGQFIFILAITVIIACFIPPVLAAENTTTDAATNYYNIGKNLLGMNEYQRAIAAFDQALASDTTMIRQSDALLLTYQNKAYALIQLARYDEAIITVDEGLAIYPEDSWLWNDKGYALFNLGRYPEAVDAYDSAIGLDPNYTNALINKGQALFSMGRYPEAADAYTRAEATDPGNSEATAGIARAQAAAEAGTQTTLIVLGIIGIAAACVIVWYVKFRKPAPKKSPEKKTRKPKKK